MQVYIHVHGTFSATRSALQMSQSPFTLHPWMGRDDDDAMTNWRLYAKAYGIDPDKHLMKCNVTDQIVQHLDLIEQLKPDDTFRDESLYAAVISPGGEFATILIIRAPDQSQANLAYLALRLDQGVTSATALDQLRGVVNIGEPIAHLKGKIAQYFGAQAA